MSLTKIGSIGINTGIQFAGVTTVSTLHVGSGVTLSSDGDVFATGISTFSEDIKVGSGITLSPDGDGFYTGVVTATSFSGSGANLTGIDTDLVSDTSPQLGGNLDVNTKNIVFGDSGGATDDRLTFGAGTDLSIYHDGTHSNIVNTNTSGYISIDTDNFRVRDDDGSENIIRGFKDSGVELYHNNVKKLETTSDGATVTGSLTVTDDITLQDDLLMGDTDTIKLGDGADLQLYHDGSNSAINDIGTGNFYIQGSDNIYIRDYDTSENHIVMTKNGAVELYHNGTKKIETTSSGVSITGNCNVDGNITLSDSEEIQIGNSTDFRIYHDGNNTFLRDVGTGSLSISGSQVSLDSSNLAEYMVRAIENGAVELYHNGIKKLQTNDTYGTICSNTTDDANYTNTLLLTRRGYETSGYGVIFQAKGGSNSSQNGLNIRLGTGDGSYLDKFTFDNDGLKFNGDTGAGNALADYEEGTWTPIFSGWSNISYSGSRNAEYLKIGDLVYIRGFIAGSSTGSNSGNISIGGLPFTPNSGGYGRHAVSLQGSGFALGSGNAGVFGLIGEGSAIMDIYGGNASGTGINIDVSKWNGSGIYFAGTYHVMGF